MSDEKPTHTGQTDPHIAIAELREQAEKAVRARRFEIASVLVVVATLGGFAAWLISETRTVAYAQSSVVAQKQEATAAKLDAHLLDDAQDKRLQKEDTHELQADVRVLSRQIEAGGGASVPARLRTMPDGGPVP